jgi:hypothetical protein
MTGTIAKPKSLSKLFTLDRRHRFWMRAGGLAAAAVCLAIAVYGFDYYLLPSAQRAFAAKHEQLKPGGSLGHPMGICGGALMALMYLYALRKRWRWLGRIGKTKHWLDYHILMGLAIPVLVTFHAAFKLQGIAGLAYWLMMAVVASGIVGRYLYGRIPRRIDAAEMTLDEMQQLRAQLTEQVASSKVISMRQLEPLLRLPSLDQVQTMPVWKALGTLIVLDLKRPFLLLKLRRSTGGLIVHNQELKEALAIVKKQTAISRNILFLSKIQKTFHLWHVVHRPFSYSLAVLVVLHVVVTLVLGFY